MLTAASLAQVDKSNVDQQEQPVEAVSLLAQPLKRMALAPQREQKLRVQLAQAKQDYDRDPNKVEHIIWYGRRLAYLWHYRDAIKVYSEGIKRHPSDARLYRHWGHRYITLRKFELAIADLTRASQLIAGKPDVIEPDGQPNAAGIPTSTLHTNIWYHLGLARYLQGEFELALAAYRKCLEASKNNDMRVATLDWMYMSLCRLGRNQEAAKLIEGITPELKVIENHAYHNRLLMYRNLKKPGELVPEKATQDRALDLATYGYGVGNWHLINGRKRQAVKVFEEILDGPYWSAFGYIAAEADLAMRIKNAN